MIDYCAPRMDKRIWKTLLIFVLLDAVLIVVNGGRFCNNPSPPVCADDCDGNGYYLNEDETACIRCPECPPGEELNKACGNGLNGDAVCIPCRKGFFSSPTSKQCTPCTTCINTVEREPCQFAQDRVCGDCLPGFVRSSDRFSIDRNACPDRCSDLPRDAPQCSDWWNNQQEGPVEEELSLKPVPTEQPVEVVPLDWPDACEPEPPQCIDHCHDGNYYLDYDGMCKACLQCQPGEELNKICGRGKNGDAYCRRCPEGTFSVDGLGRCIPCRICVNTVATECTSARDSECGECLPGYYQDADGFFPDRGACPNKCGECPTTIPQCQEWCKSKIDTGEVPTVAEEFIGRDTVSPQAVETDVFQPDPDKEGINNEVSGSPSPYHASYTIILIVIPSLLAAVVITLVIILIVFRHLWKNPAAESTLLPGPSATSSPGSTPQTVYRPTVDPIAPAENALDFMTFVRTLSSAAFQNLTGSRPASGSSIDVENRSSAASTPTMNLNRRLSNRDLLRDTQRQQSGNDRENSSESNPRHQLPDPWRAGEEHTSVNPAGSLNHAGPVDVKENHPIQSTAAGQFDRDPRPNAELGYSEDNTRPCVSSCSNFITEEFKNVQRNLEDQEETPGRQVRRRHSNNISNNSNDPKPKDNRSKSLPGLHLRSGYKKSRKGSYGNAARGREPEAALFPPDSTSNDGPTTNVPANPQNLGRYFEPTASPHTTLPYEANKKPRATNTTLATLREIIPTEITPRKTPFPEGMINSGNKSPGETNVTIHINMTAKDVETFHVGDVHNRHNYAHQTDLASEQHYEDGDQDDDEAEKLLNINTTETDAIPAGNGRSKLTCGDDGDDVHDDIGEEDNLLDPKSS